MIHLTQSTYSDRFTLVKGYQNVSALIQNVFLRMIQSLVVSLFHSKISSNPLLVKCPESGLIAWFIRYYLDILSFTLPLRILHPLQQRLIRQKVLPFFNRLPKIVPGLLRYLLDSRRYIYRLLRKRVGHSLSFGRQHHQSLSYHFFYDIAHRRMRVSYLFSNRRNCLCLST